MYSFRENWGINLTICSTVPRLSLWLLPNLPKSKVLFQCHSEIRCQQFMAPWNGFHSLAKEKYIGLIRPRSTSP